MLGPLVFSTGRFSDLSKPGWWRIELQTKVREDFTIKEKDPTEAFTFKTLCLTGINLQYVDMKLGYEHKGHRGRVWLA